MASTSGYWPPLTLPSDRPLADQTVIIGGGTGDVGEGLVAMGLAAGARVIVPVRSPDRQARLQAFLTHFELADLAREHLHWAPGAIANPAGSAALGHWLDQHLPQWGDRLDLAIASLGSWYDGVNLLDLDPAQWERCKVSNLDTHFYLARAVLPRMIQRDRGSYVFLNGKGAEIVTPGAGLTSVLDAAQKMLALSLAAETAHTGVRVWGVASFSPIKTRSEPKPDPDWLSLSDLALAIIDRHNDRDLPAALSPEFGSDRPTPDQHDLSAQSSNQSSKLWHRLYTHTGRIG